MKDLWNILVKKIKIKIKNIKNKYLQNSNGDPFILENERGVIGVPTVLQQNLELHWLEWKEKVWCVTKKDMNEKNYYFCE